MLAPRRRKRPRRKHDHSIVDLGSGMRSFQGYADYIHVKTCLSKLRYEDEFDVIDACISLSRKYGPCRYYECPDCGGFHITTQVEDLNEYQNQAV